ncbi:MAG: Rpn family recombination-promoting nuclease/putative transposase [Acidobacteriota bacterium]|nr:Rpn family recombination-promoting nuclease/putative transposase [Acidobacteriota bacterium]
MSEKPKPPRQSSQIAQPHDALFRRVFSEPAQAAALLRETLPVAVRDRFAWNTLRRLPDTFVDERLRRTESDLLFEVDQPGGEPPVRLYVLIEHQSSPDPFMALRLLRYCTSVLEAAVREVPERKRLPAVLPVVFHQGRRPWPYPTSLDGLLGESARDLPWGPRLDFLLLDQGAGGLSTVVGSPLGRLAQYLMLAVSGPESERAAALERAVELMRNLLSAERPHDLEVFHSYVFHGREDPAMMKEVEAMLEEIEARGPDSELKSLGQLIWERGQRTGRSEGVRLGEHRATVATVEGLLRAGVDWRVIESATGLDRGGFNALKEQLGSDRAS